MLSRNESGTVPVSEIKAYCEFYGIKDMEFRRTLLLFVNGMIEELLDYQDTKRKQEEAKQKHRQKNSK